MKSGHYWPLIVHFFAEQFVETADLLVDRIAEIAYCHEFSHTLLENDDSDSPDAISSFVRRCRDDQSLMTSARAGEFVEADQHGWDELLRLIWRIDVLLERGDIHLLDCRSTTRRFLLYFWERFSRITKPLRRVKCARKWPLIGKKDAECLHSLCLMIREAEGVEFATPEEAREWAWKSAWQSAKSKGLVESKSEWLAQILTQSREMAKSPIEAASEVTVDSLIEARNWANRLQWCAHDFLEEISSKDSQRIMEDDFNSFWNDRWNVRLIPLVDVARESVKYCKSVFPYLQSLARERGLYFGHAGFQVEFAHESPDEIARTIIGCVDFSFPDGFCAIREECENVIGQLLVRPRWNPKELEAQLFDECAYAISRLNRGMTLRHSDSSNQGSHTQPQSDEAQTEVVWSPVKASLEKRGVVKARDVATNQTIEVDVSNASIFGPKIFKSYTLPGSEAVLANEHTKKPEQIRRTETLYRLQTGRWLLVIFDDLTLPLHLRLSPPTDWTFSDLRQPTHCWEMKYLTAEQAAGWMTNVLGFSTERLVVTFGLFAGASPAISATTDPPKPKVPTVVPNSDLTATEAQAGGQSDLTKFEQIPKGELRGVEKENVFKMLRLIRNNGPLKLSRLVELMSPMAESTIKSNYVRFLKAHFGIQRHSDGGYFDPSVAIAESRDVAQRRAT